MIEQLQTDLYNCFLSADRAQSVSLLTKYADQYSYEKAVKDLLEPTLAVFGDRWVKVGDVSLAHGYIVGKIAEDILIKVADERKKTANLIENKNVAIMGNIEDDFHALGRKLVTTFLRASGWEVHDLGNDVPAEDFIAKALEVNATVIGVSAMMYTTAMNIKKLRAEIDNRKLSNKFKLAVGGAIFRLRPTLIEEVGGDGTVGNALQAPDLFARLNKSLLEGGVR